MRKLAAFLRTPKGLLTLLLLALTAIAAPGEGLRTVLLNMGAAVLAAGLLDAMILRWRHGAWEYPSGAVLTAMIVAMVLRAQGPWTLHVATAVLAVASKYVFRTRQANVFNPAALALVVMFHLLPHGQSWWGALPQVEPVWLRAVLLGGGFYIASRVNKLPLVLTFLAAHFTLFTATAFLGDARQVAEIFRSPDVDAVIYFALLILTDPPTSPAKYDGQWIYALIAALTSYAVFMIFGVVYFLLAGVLVANVWEAWRRARRRTARHSGHSAARAET